MPIKDLSDVVRLPRLGKIRLGTRDPDRGFPRKADHFVFPKDHSDYQKLLELYHEAPKSLPILIPVEDEELWATQYYRSYNQTYGLICKGDGETALRMVDVETEELPKANKAGTVRLKDIPCLGKGCPIYQNKEKGKSQCHEVMNLRFILPQVPGLGVWQIDTGSKNSILNINNCARIIKRAFGRISMIPLTLTFEPMQVNNPEDGKKQTVYVLNLRSEVTLAQLADTAREQAKLLSIGAMTLADAFELEVEQDIDKLWGKKEPEAPEKPDTLTTAPEPIPQPTEAQNSGIPEAGSPIPPEGAKKESKTKPTKTGAIPEFKTASELFNYALGHGISLEEIRNKTGCAHPLEVLDLREAIKALYPEKGV